MAGSQERPDQLRLSRDGRLHIQGPNGEATMWEGKWSLKGGQLSLVNSSMKQTKKVTATIEGHELLLDVQRYRRFRLRLALSDTTSLGGAAEVR